MKRVVSLIRTLLVNLTALLVPRSRGIWVVGGNKGLRFADNSMYFFLYCVAHADKKVVWLTRSKDIVEEVEEKGGTAFLTNSFRGLYYGFRAKWHVFDVAISDTNIYSSVGARQLNLWHGYPLKDLRFLKRGSEAGTAEKSLKARIKRCLFRQASLRDRSYLLWQNDAFKQHALDSFYVDECKILKANMPRNIVFEDDFDEGFYLPRVSKDAREQIAELRSEGKKIVGYFPTWRGSGNDLFMGTDDASKLLELDAYCQKNDIIIVTKWHSCLYKEYQHSGESERAQDLTSILKSMTSVLVLGFELDLNSILTECDLLITDYSGVLFDFLWSEKPIIFFPYDLDSYTNEWGFFFDYKDFVPGDIVMDLEGLCSTLSRFCNDPAEYDHNYKEARERTRASIFEETEGSALIARQIQAID